MAAALGRVARDVRSRSAATPSHHHGRRGWPSIRRSVRPVPTSVAARWAYCRRCRPVRARRSTAKAAAPRFHGGGRARWSSLRLPWCCPAPSCAQAHRSRTQSPEAPRRRRRRGPGFARRSPPAERRRARPRRSFPRAEAVSRSDPNCRTGMPWPRSRCCDCNGRRICGRSSVTDFCNRRTASFQMSLSYNVSA